MRETDERRDASAGVLYLRLPQNMRAVKRTERVFG